MNEEMKVSTEIPEVKSGGLKILREQVFDYIKLRLGSDMIDIQELGPKTLNMCIDRAVRVYRQRSNNALEESYAFFTMQKNVQDYYLPQEVTMVKQLFRRSIGYTQGTNDFEPFESGFLNCYMLAAGQAGGQSGALLTYELFSGYQDQTARMFGGYLTFQFDVVTKKLSIDRRPNASGETVMVWCFNLKPEVHLLSNYLIRPWIEGYAYALAKFSLGEARSKFGSIAGPNGSTQLNGNDLKTEAKDEMKTLEDDIKLYTEGSVPLSFIYG